MASLEVQIIAVPDDVLCNLTIGNRNIQLVGGPAISAETGEHNRATGPSFLPRPEMLLLHMHLFVLMAHLSAAFTSAPLAPILASPIAQAQIA